MTDMWPEMGCCGIGVTREGSGPVAPKDPCFDHWECMDHEGRLRIVPRLGSWVGVCPETGKTAIRLSVIAPVDR